MQHAACHWRHHHLLPLFRDSEILMLTLLATSVCCGSVCFILSTCFSLANSLLPQTLLLFTRTAQMAELTAIPILASARMEEGTWFAAAQNVPLRTDAGVCHNSYNW